MAQLHVLLLVFTHRHIIRLIQQNIRRHQGGIGKQTAVDVVCVFGRLILELGHPGQFAEHGIAVQHPAQLCMLVNVALDKQGILLRVQAAGNVLSQLLQGPPAQICRILPDRDGVQIRHEIITVKGISPLRPVLDGAQVRTQGQVTGGLDAGEHPFLGSFRNNFTHKHSRFLCGLCGLF